MGTGEIPGRQGAALRLKTRESCERQREPHLLLLIGPVLLSWLPAARWGLVSASRYGQWAVSGAEVRCVPSRRKHLKSSAWGLQASLQPPAMETLELHALRDRAAGVSEFVYRSMGEQVQTDYTTTPHTR